jgi:hypothetical protein
MVKRVACRAAGKAMGMALSKLFELSCAYSPKGPDGGIIGQVAVIETPSSSQGDFYIKIWT